MRRSVFHAVLAVAQHVERYGKRHDACRRITILGRRRSGRSSIAAKARWRHDVLVVRQLDGGRPAPGATHPACREGPRVQVPREPER